MTVCPMYWDMMLGGDNDTDGDGLPDAFETIRTGTDPPAPIAMAMAWRMAMRTRMATG